MAQSIVLVLLTLSLPSFNLEYIPPGPTYPCPKQTELLFPCICEKGTDSGLFVQCENAGLAMLSVGLGNIAGLGLPIERLLLKECKITHVFGTLLHRLNVRILIIENTPIETMDANIFIGVNRTLQELKLLNTKISEFPKDAFKLLGNLSTLVIDGHNISTLEKNIFSGSELPNRLEYLRIVNGLITELPVEPFQHLKKLKTLDFHHNKIATLKRNQFKGLREAEVLDLSFNSIIKLDGSHLADLTKLGWCNVSHNQLADIPRGMFARNTLLKVLHLNGNKIKKLDTNSFRGMRFLRRLFLQDNLISDVGRGTFASVTRIGTVDLARNKITKVDYQMFQQVKYAEVINLAENRISLIEKQAFTDLYLAVVNVSHNELTNIEYGAFQNCNNMTLLDLSFNNLTEINKGAFDENSYALEFQVSYNKFTNFGQIPIHNMTGLKIVNASHNDITTVPRNAFPKLYELHTVDISYNNLTDIYNSVFQNLFSLRFLNLSHNSMEHIKPATFGAIPTVLELDLSHNQLTDVSRGSLAKLVSCRVIDISNNYLDKIFQIPISLGELIISRNKLTEIRSNTWPTMNALLRLDLSHNQLADNLKSDSFNGLLVLQRLDLSDNQLTKPPWEALGSMTSLQYLYLQNNMLTSLQKASFGRLPTMFELNLSNNSIADISIRAFEGMQQLINLNLTENSINHIPNEAFKGLVALRLLDLSHNQLESIDNKTHGLLDDLLSLETLNLSHNNFGFLTKKMFPYSPYIPYKLYELDLSHNTIPVLTNDFTVGTKKLKKLNLSNNIINDVRNNVLGNLTSLEVLLLSGNRLQDLTSRTSDIKFVFPENITELDLSYNQLAVLPVDQLLKAEKLKSLDLRNNNLVTFDPLLVKRIQTKGLTIHFKGNTLMCNCYIRPLKHYINRLSNSNYIEHYNLKCSEPEQLKDQNLYDIDEDRLICSGNIDEETRDGNTESYNFVAEPDVSFRDLQFAQAGINVHWFVYSLEDVANFIVYIRDGKNNFYYNEDARYTLRSTTIAIDDKLKVAIQNGGLELCIAAKDSKDFTRKWFGSQCRAIPKNYQSWPKNLVVDKRRLTKRRFFATSSVLGLVSDSILITLCIFLGVCFGRLSDFH